MWRCFSVEFCVHYPCDLHITEIRSRHVHGRNCHAKSWWIAFWKCEFISLFFRGGGVSFSVRKNKWQRNPPEAPSKPLLSHPLWKRKALLAKERVFVKDSEYTHTLKERERQQMETETLSRCANEKFAFNDDGSIPNSTNLFWFFASPTLIILQNPSTKKKKRKYTDVPVMALKDHNSHRPHFVIF